MKTPRNIFMAFVLNLLFSVFEFWGGLLTGSVAIISDAVHDAGDSLGIGISYFLEKKSKKQSDEQYTYGYMRYSAIGGLITTLFLLLGSVTVVCNAIKRIIVPVEISYDRMILFAIVGVCVNSCAVFFTRGGHSISQRAVNLHMLEDVIGWLITLLGAVMMHFTNFFILDPLISIGVSIFILINAIKNLNRIMVLFLEKAPHDIKTSEIADLIKKIRGVTDIHHIHIWSLDEENTLATMHIVTDIKPHEIKHKIRNILQPLGINHITLEIESSIEHCCIKECSLGYRCNSVHMHNH